MTGRDEVVIVTDVHLASRFPNPQEDMGIELYGEAEGSVAEAAEMVSSTGRDRHCRSHTTC